MTSIDKRILEQTREELLAPDESGIQVPETFDHEKIYVKKGGRVDRLRFTFSEPESDLPAASMHNWLEKDREEAGYNLDATCFFKKVWVTLSDNKCKKLFCRQASV